MSDTTGRGVRRVEHAGTQRCSDGRPARDTQSGPPEQQKRYVPVIGGLEEGGVSWVEVSDHDERTHHAVLPKGATP